MPSNFNSSLPAASPRASVIISAYNAAGTLARAAESVLRQTESDLELLIVDDASTDGTLQVIQDLAARDERVSALRFHENRGKSSAMNAAIARARGDWVAVLDADDWFHDQRLARLLDLGDHHGTDLVADNQFFFDAGAERVVRTAFRTPPEIRRLDRRRFIRASNPYASFDYGMLKPIVRSSFLRRARLRYRENARLSQDFLFLVEFFAAGGGACVSGEPLYFWTQAFGTYSRRWTNTGAGPWRYDYRKAMGATHDVLDDLSRAKQKDLTMLLRRRLRAYRQLTIVSDLARQSVTGAPTSRLAMTVLRNPGIWGELLRRLVRRLYRARVKRSLAACAGSMSVLSRTAPPAGQIPASVPD